MKQLVIKKTIQHLLNETKSIFKFYFIGEALEDRCIQNGKSILLFSMPHSGKTTLLQGIMNFIFGVSSADSFRLCFAPALTVKVRYFLTKRQKYNSFVKMQFIHWNARIYIITGITIDFM